MNEAPNEAARRRPDQAAFVIAVLLAVVAVVIFWTTAHMGRSGARAQLGPTAFPYVIGAILLVLAALTAIEARRGDFPDREPEKIAPVLWIVGGLAAQMLLLKIAGFGIATGLLFAATAKGFGRGPLWMTVPIGIVISLVVWFIFAKGLQLSLPAGPIERLL